MTSPHDDPQRLRVATYNIHKGVTRGLGLRSQVRIHELRQRVAELDADLVCLQEVQGRHERHAQRFAHWPEQPQADFLAHGAGYHTVYAKAASYLHGDHGNALLSRFPIVQSNQRDISDHVFEKRGVLHCALDVHGHTVHVFVVHLGLFAQGRMRQVEAICQWIQRIADPDAPLIIAGDFNDWRNVLTETLQNTLSVREVFDHANPDWVDATLQNLKTRAHGYGMQTQLIDKTAKLLKRRRAARTFPSLLPFVHLDRIYQRGFEVQQVQVLSGPRWMNVSDHAPLIAELTFPHNGLRSNPPLQTVRQESNDEHATVVSNRP